MYFDALFFLAEFCPPGYGETQSVRWGDNRSLKGVDGNKKVKGVKRHVVVDKNGFLLAVMVTIAWFDNYRKLSRNYEFTFDSAEEMVKLASIRMLLNKI